MYNNMISTFEFSENVVGLIVDSDLDEATTKQLNRQIEKKIEEYGKINLFVELKKDKTISLLGMIKSLSFKLRNAKHFGKIALVAEVGWFKNLMEINDYFLDTEIATFSNEDRVKAIYWISE